MKSKTEAALRLAEIRCESSVLELEACRINLEQAENSSLDGHDDWLPIATSASLYADQTGESDDLSTRQKVRRLAEAGKISAKRQTRRDGQPGKKWMINKLSLIRFIEKRANSYGEYYPKT